MRSGTSYFNWTVFKKTVLRFWPLWSAYFALWFIALPLSGLMMLRLDSSDRAASAFYGGYMKNFADYTVLNASDGAAVFALIFGLLAAMAVFSHLYNARPANLFGSLPIRREGLFLTHYLAGLSFAVVPYVVIFLLTLLIEAVGGYVDAQGLLFWLGVSCGEYLFFYSLAVFCGMFTGHILALPAFYGIVNLFAYGIEGLLYVVLHAFCYGFAGFGNWADTVVKVLTPVMCLEQEVGHYWQGPDSTVVFHGMELVAAYCLAGLALTACAFLLYRARRLESAGDVVSVRPMRPVFKYGVAICAGLLFGVGTSFVVGGGEGGLMAAILFWGVIGYFAAQMMLDKTFRVFKKWKGAAAVAAVFLALFAVVEFDLTGYETRIPSADQIKSVYVDGLNAVSFWDDGDRLDLNIEDPAQIELIRRLHQAAVDQRDSQVHSDGLVYSSETSVGVRLVLAYTLNNGSTLSRSYTVDLRPDEISQEGTSAWLVQQLYNDRELSWRRYGFDVLENQIAQGRRLDSAEFSHDNPMWGTETCVVGYGADARTLLDAVEEDLLAGRIGVRLLTDERVIHGSRGMEDYLTFRVLNPANGNIQYSVNIVLQDTATSTIAALKELPWNAELDQEENAVLRDALKSWWE